jgi:hypothetical protein
MGRLLNETNLVLRAQVFLLKYLYATVSPASSKSYEVLGKLAMVAAEALQGMCGSGTATANAQAERLRVLMTAVSRYHLAQKYYYSVKTNVGLPDMLTALSFGTAALASVHKLRSTTRAVVNSKMTILGPFTNLALPGGLEEALCMATESFVGLLQKENNYVYTIHENRFLAVDQPPDIKVKATTSRSLPS